MSNSDQFSAQPTPQKSGGSSTLKIVLIVLGVLGVLCCGGIGAAVYFGAGYLNEMMATVVSDAVKTSPEVKAEIGEVESITINYEGIAEEQEASGEAGVLVYDVKGSTGEGKALAKVTTGAQQADWIKFRTSDGREFELQSDMVLEDDVDGPAVDFAPGA
jgi:hypothetical protein